MSKSNIEQWLNPYHPFMVPKNTRMLGAYAGQAESPSALQQMPRAQVKWGRHQATRLCWTDVEHTGICCVAVAVTKVLDCL